MKDFRTLLVWQKSHFLTLSIYKQTLLMPKVEMFGLTSQIRRSVSSIPTNIAEGCGKNTNAEFAHFLNIALGSANEAEYFLILSKDLNYLTVEKFQ